MRKLCLLLAVFACLSCSPGRKVVTLGDERFGEYLPLLEGRRVAILSNQSGIVGDKVYNWCLEGGSEVTPETVGVPFGHPSDTANAVAYGPHLLDVLIDKGIDVRAVFSPEHGFRGAADAGEHVSSSVDDKTGVPIISLYGRGREAVSDADMDRFDVLVVDIQDVGLRYYTYYVTMLRMMMLCAANGKQVIVLDRPNPNGFYVDGPILDMQYKSGIGALPIAMVHGMTMGELALMINGEGWLGDGLHCDLTVIPCKGYNHSMHCTLVIAPSPNLKDMRSIYLYSSTCFFEGTIVTAGRGTSFPFEVYGHPQMADRGFSFIPRSIPGAKNPRYLDQICYGVDLRYKPLDEIWREQINLDYMLDAIRHMPDSLAFFGPTNHFELQIGVSYVRDMLLAGRSASEIKACWASDVEAFKVLRRPYLLYPEQ
ncbi:MAG: DUF1343 domain-containing protein [Bacteroidales bacterium]|nr:DUF1343 domain-containing protein [Bacteroidales bacterium]